jgi:hypothetical protein
MILSTGQQLWASVGPAAQIPHKSPGFTNTSRIPPFDAAAAPHLRRPPVVGYPLRHGKNSPFVTKNQFLEGVRLSTLCCSHQFGAGVLV